MSDIPAGWNTPEAKAKALETRREKKSLREDIDAVLFSFDNDSLGRQAWIRQFALGSDENKRALLQARVRLEPTEVRGQVDTNLTVTIVQQVGDKTIRIAGGSEAHLKRPPRDAITGEFLEVVSSDA